MKTFALSLLTIASLAADSFGLEVPPPGIHIGGQVNKPGYYPLTKAPTLEELTKTFGGVNEIGASRRIIVIRFVADRVDPPIRQVQKTIPLEELKQEDGTYDLKAGDFIFVPTMIGVGQ